MVDKRPICDCSAYKFPHRVGGRCKGYDFTTFYFYNIKELCELCNCNNNGSCDASTGLENIRHAECYQEALREKSGEHLIINYDMLYGMEGV